MMSPSSAAHTLLRPVVVIPVYGAATELAQCLDSILVGLPDDVRVLIADDASQDPAVAEAITRFVRSRVAVECSRRTRNLGFVGNVNRAIADLPGEDVVLLNSDTWVTPGWLERMLETAALDPMIATVTPWSNNAEICSYPEFCVDNPFPAPAAAERIAAAAQRLDASVAPDLPTAVGFAMLIRRAAINALGDFDAATFGRGYGEENDFCLRAQAHGWRNVLCPRAYVAHRGNVSFAAVGERPGGENLRRLVARYPHYNTLVADFIARDPLRPWRERLSAELAATCTEKED